MLVQITQPINPAAGLSCSNYPTLELLHGGFSNLKVKCRCSKQVVESVNLPHSGAHDQGLMHSMAQLARVRLTQLLVTRQVEGTAHPKRIKTGYTDEKRGPCYSWEICLVIASVRIYETVLMNISL